MGDILEIVLDVLGEDPRVTREELVEWAKHHKIHRFDDGVVFEKENEIHIHFFNPNWFYVKKKLIPIIRDILKKYSEIDTVTDVDKAKKALLAFGCEEIDGRIILTKERFENVFCNRTTRG